VAWIDTNIVGGDAFVRRSTDNGATWKPKVNLSNSANNGDDLSQIAASGSNVYVVWFGVDEVFTGDSDIFFRRSTDNGATWKSIVPLSNSGEAFSPQLAVSGSSVYVAWQDHDDEPSSANSEVYFRRSADNGATWKSIVDLSNNDGESGSPQIAASGSNLYIVWADNTPAGNLDSFFRRSTDNGATWKPVINLSKNAGSSEDQQIGV
jgi:Neuraminidase (sialidase)